MRLTWRWALRGFVMIEESDNFAELRQCFNRVFISRSPWEPAGVATLPCRAVLYPTDGYQLTKEQYHAVRSAMGIVNDRTFALSPVEAEPEARNWHAAEDFLRHYVGTDAPYGEYVRHSYPIENAIYSTTGTWGILLSHEYHGLLVCNRPFWNAFSATYPQYRADLREFLSKWSEHRCAGIDTAWLDPFVQHLTVYAP
jgi:hypothetical protein